MKEPKIQISPRILDLIAEIDEFKGRWSMFKALSPDRLQVLKTVATIESIGSSTRIEGVKLSDQEVEKLLSGLERHSFRSRDEEEVAGYAELMNVIFESFNEIPLTENYVKQLHGILLKFSAKDIFHRGEYKKLPNNVEAFDARGKSIGVVFEAASPFDTPLRMKELVEWTVKSLEQKTLHSLLIIAVFVLHFLAIHPFQDGNGRLSRALTTYLLLKNGYSYVPYSSMEHIIEDNKEQYYLALRRSQKNLGMEAEDLGQWLIYFLNCLKTQKDILLQKVERESLFAKVPELSSKILGLAKEHGRVTNAVVQAETKANRNTIKTHLQKLVAEGHLIQHGEGKGTWYTLA